MDDDNIYTPVSLDDNTVTNAQHKQDAHQKTPLMEKTAKKYKNVPIHIPITPKVDTSITERCGITRERYEAVEMPCIYSSLGIILILLVVLPSCIR